MTLLMAAPVVLSPSDRIFGGEEILSPGDPNRDALVVINQFRIGHVPPPYLQPLTDLPGRWLTWLIGPVAAYNFLVLITFPLAAAAAYLLARYALDSHAGALVAGLAYAFLPFHVMQAGGHPHIAQTQWLPLYLLALWRCVDQPNPLRATVLLLAAAAAALADFYGGFIIAVVSPVALLAWGMGSPKRLDHRARRVTITALVLIAAALAGLGIVGCLVPEVMTRPSATAFPRSELFDWSARWWSYLVPPADHPLWGSAVQAFWLRRGIGVGLLEHQQVSLGLSLIALAIVALWLRFRGDSSTMGLRAAPALSVVAAVALLCSLSPERTVLSFTFLRPSAFLYEVAPMFRGYARFGVVVGLMTSLLAGAGVAALWRSRGPARLAAAALLGIAAIEYAPFPPWRSRDVLPTAAHRFLSDEPGPIRVLDCVEPIRVSDTLAAGLLRAEVSLLGGAGFDDCGEPRLGEKLGLLGFTHLIVRRRTALGDWIARDSDRFARDRGLTPVVAYAGSLVFAVTAPATARNGYLSAWTGFFPREYERDRSWRWMKDAGILQFKGNRESAGESIEIELRSFPGNRRIDWSINGRRLGEIEVSPEWRSHTLALGRLGGDVTSLTLATREPAVIADRVLHNQDPRPLGLAVGEWRLKAERD